ncbi:Hypothetical predicted protein [Paramuricea clavata]|uniref:Uncharacterized protein n=1 Tax=Paramuricea clavata TaxID=317549 RepID=A0A6S7G928_PARCT|nr:Hypothetical predicted protein [Paramuricea clavata]
MLIRILLLFSILCVSIITKRVHYTSQILPKDIFISSELTALPEKLCYVWVSTLSCNNRHRYGLDLQISRKISQVAILLLGGDIATNPGPNSTRPHIHTNGNNQSILRCYYQNVRSIRSGNKLREFQDTVYANQYDIVAISESWLTSDISDSELLPWNYDIFRCDRKSLTISRGGGVLLASRSNLRCSPVVFTKNNNIELSAIEINTRSSGKILVAVVYRPPCAHTNWIYDIVESLNECTYSKVILLGDFNLPTITWLDGSGFCDSSDSASFTFCQCLSDNNLFQLIDSPTRLNNCVDLLLTNICEHVINISVSECESIGVPSYHKALTFDLNFTARTPNDNRQESFNLKKANFEGLRTALRNDPLENYLDTDNDVEHNWTSWKTQLFSKLNAFIPKRKPRKFITPPWIDGEVTHAIRRKNSLWKRGKEKNNSATWERFREKRKKNISDSCISHPDRFWSYFNRLTRRSNIPETVDLNGRSHSDARSNANAFNTYFTTVFNSDTSIPSNLPSSLYTHDIVSTLEFSHEEVLSSLQNFNSSKTPGPDNLHPRILKECANELAPVFKRGCKALVPNYRQISLLSIVSKFCERCVLRNLLSKLSHLLTSAQHGFVRGRSCITQLLSVLHDVGTALDAGDEVYVVYQDYSKAFDSVPHGRLLHKLSLFGIQGPLHAWFTDYLHSRSKRVAIEGTFSSWVPVTSGFPQGSILGPFLFLLYVNDLPDVLSNSTSIALFADDAKCSHVGS